MGAHDPRQVTGPHLSLKMGAHNPRWVPVITDKTQVPIIEHMDLSLNTGIHI